MKLFGHPMSTCTRKTLFTLHETATPFEFGLVDFAKGHIYLGGLQVDSRPRR